MCLRFGTRRWFRTCSLLTLKCEVEYRLGNRMVVRSQACTDISDGYPSRKDLTQLLLSESPLGL